MVGIVGVLAVLFVAAGVIDFRARRRGLRYRGVDASAARNDRTGVNAAEAEMRMRMGNGGTGGGSLF